MGVQLSMDRQGDGKGSTTSKVEQQGYSLKHIEKQIGQLASYLQYRPKGSLPSDTVPNLKGSKPYCAVLRSGRGSRNCAHEKFSKDTEKPDILEQHLETDKEGQFNEE